VGQEALGQPGAPFDQQHLLEIQPVHRGDDEDQREEREHAELEEKIQLVARLERVVEVPVPGVELQLQPDQRHGEPHYGGEQGQADAALFRHPIGSRDGPESL